MPDQFKMLRNHSHLLKTEAQRFLMLGRMLHTLEFDTPSVTLQIFAKRDGEWKPIPLEERSVLSSSWQSPEGNVGHCLVNITHEQQVFQLFNSTHATPPVGRRPLSTCTAPTSPRRPSRNAAAQALPHVQTIELAFPLEAVFFVMRPGVDCLTESDAAKFVDAEHLDFQFRWGSPVSKSFHRVGVSPSSA